VEKEHSHMLQKIVPSASKAHELAALLQGQPEANNREELLSTFGQLAPERRLQEA